MSWVIGVVSEGHKRAAVGRVMVGVGGWAAAEFVAADVLDAAFAPQVEYAGAELVAVALAVAAAGGVAAAVVAACALLAAVSFA